MLQKLGHEVLRRTLVGLVEVFPKAAVKLVGGVFLELFVLANKPHAQRGVEVALVLVFFKERLDRLPVGGKQALLLGGVVAVEELVAQQVARVERHALGVDTLKDQLRVVVARQLDHDGKELSQALEQGVKVKAVGGKLIGKEAVVALDAL